MREPLRGHPEQVDQLGVVGVGHEDLHQALDEPGAVLVVPEAGVAGDGGVGDDHVLPGGPGPGDVHGRGAGVGDTVQGCSSPLLGLEDDAISCIHC